MTKLTDTWQTHQKHESDETLNVVCDG